MIAFILTIFIETFYTINLFPMFLHKYDIFLITLIQQRVSKIM